MPLALDDERLPQRFWSKVSPEPNSGCWLWVGSTDRHGYGQLRLSRKKLCYAHRLSYSVEKKAEALVIDHLCRTPLCVNPEHLEAVPQAENMARGTLRQRQREARVQQVQTRAVCKNGLHSPVPWVYRKTGKRQCGACLGRGSCL